jgi:hypothetical protein
MQASLQRSENKNAPFRGFCFDLASTNGNLSNFYIGFKAIVGLSKFAISDKSFVHECFT